METIEQIAKEKSIDIIELGVWNFNEPAKKFYSKMGYNIKSMRLEKK